MKMSSMVVQVAGLGVAGWLIRDLYDRYEVLLLISSRSGLSSRVRDDL